MSALERLFAPLAVDELIRTYWMRRSIYIAGGSTKIGELFSLDAFHAAVAAAARRTDAGPRGFSVRAGPVRTIMPWTIASELAAGETICVSGIELGDERLAAFAADLKRELAFPGHVGVHAYLSPPGSGFSFVHFDARIATTLQILGRKRWRYADASSLPWPAHNVRFAKDGHLDWHQPPTAWEQRAEIRQDISFSEVILAPGDVLCLPAGTLHAAEAAGELSLSINLHFNFGGFFKMIDTHLRETLSELPGWREPPPPVLAFDRGGNALPEQVSEYITARLDELRRLLDRLDPRGGNELGALWRKAVH